MLRHIKIDRWHVYCNLIYTSTKRNSKQHSMEFLSHEIESHD